MIAANLGIALSVAFLHFSLVPAPFSAVSIFYGASLITVCDIPKLIALLYMVYFYVELMRKLMFLKSGCNKQYSAVNMCYC